MSMKLPGEGRRRRGRHPGPLRANVFLVKLLVFGGIALLVTAALIDFPVLALVGLAVESAGVLVAVSIDK